MIYSNDELNQVTLTETQAQVIIAQGPQGQQGETGPQGPQGETGAIEIYDKNSGVVEYSPFTGAQLIAKCAENKYFFTYKGAPVMYAAPASFGSTNFVFGIIERGVINNIPTPRISFYKVDSDKLILAANATTEMRSLYIPCFINGKTFTNGDSITLQAGDISAANDWSPTNNTDLATKKYVDDNTLPGVSSADAGKIPIVTNLGGWDMQKLPIVIGSTDSQAADYISPSDAIAAVSAGKTLVITHTDSVYSMGAVQFNSFVVRGGAAIVGMMAADNGDGVTLANLIGVSGSWSFSIYNIPGTGSVASGNAGYVTGGAVYTALQSAGVKEYTLTEELWDESKPYYFINQNATDHPFVWLYATADLTAEGQPLHNAIITGVDISQDGTNWTDLSADRNIDYQPVVPSKPWLITETTDDLGTCTAVVYGNKSTAVSSGLFNAMHIKIHFIKYTDGGEVND